MQTVGLLGIFAVIAAGIAQMPLEWSIPMTGIACLFLIPIGHYFLNRDNRLRERKGTFHKMPGVDALLSLLFGVVYGQIGNQIIGFLQLMERFPSYQEYQTQIVLGQPFWILLLVIGFLAPVVEELFFRGLVYLRLKDYVRPWIAVVVSALGFGIYHGNMVQFLYASFLGVIFALLYERTGSLLSCTLAHIGANMWSVVLSQYGMKLLQLGNGWVLSGIFLWILMVGAAGVLYLFPAKKAI